MTTLKFDKSVKYQGVRYAAHEVFCVEDKDVEELKKAGAVILSNHPDPEPPVVADGKEVEQESEATTEEVDVNKVKEELLGYTVPELVKFAEDHNIDLQKKTKKAEIYNIIIAAL